MVVNLLQPATALKSLRIRWIALNITAILILAFGYALLRAGWQAVYAFRWLILTSGPVVFLSWTLWAALPSNRRSGEIQLLPNLGAGTHLTLLRGLLIAALAGFLFSPRPENWLAWAPGALYTSAAIADLFDGYLARRDNHSTGLGERMDMSLDGLGILVATLLIVQYGQVPAWYFLVGLARYLFLAGTWLRRRLGKPVHPLAASTSRRPLAGAQMGFIAVMLWPLFSPPGTHLAAALFALPFLVGFARDWLTVSGALPSSLAWRRDLQEDAYAPAAGTPPSAWDVRRTLYRWFPVFLRAAAVALLIASLSSRIDLVDRLGRSSLDWQAGMMFFFYLSGLLMLALGAAGRVGALAILFALGLQQHYAPLAALELLLVACVSGLFFVGTGAFSLWTPENRVLERRLGEVAGQEL